MTNTSPKHVAWTEGPWFVGEFLEPNGNCLARPVLAQNTFIAEAMLDDEDDLQGEANARLIAAAPEMAEALERLRPLLEGVVADKCADIQEGGSPEFSDVETAASDALAILTKITGEA